MDPATSFTEQARELDPWWFSFELDGESFGGKIPRERMKTEVFADWVDRLGLQVHSVLDLGSHEGNHSLQLADMPGVTRVAGLEGRWENLARAKFVKAAFAAETVEFHHRNLETFDPDEWPGFDAVFCSGLLYHLPNPWDFLPRLAQAARRCALIDTIYVPTAPDRMNGITGRWVREPPGPLSGFSKRSFILSFESIFKLLLTNGLLPRHVTRHADKDGHQRVLVFCEKTDNAEWRHLPNQNHPEYRNPLVQIIRRLFWQPLPVPVKAIAKPILIKTLSRLSKF